jgi:hypothetical protein
LQVTPVSRKLSLRYTHLTPVSFTMGYKPWYLGGANT